MSLHTKHLDSIQSLSNLNGRDAFLSRQIWCKGTECKKVIMWVASVESKRRGWQENKIQSAEPGAEQPRWQHRLGTEQLGSCREGLELLVDKGNRSQQCASGMTQGNCILDCVWSPASKPRKTCIPTAGRQDWHALGRQHRKANSNKA